MIFTSAIGNNSYGLFASIFVTGVNQSNILTLNTPSGKIKSGKWEIKNSINGFLFEKLDEFGTYTIIASDGENTVVQDIIIDVISEYTVEIFINPYVTDGLICYLDGIWNNGNSHHSQDITKWVDLSGNNNDFVFEGNLVVNENNIQFSTGNYAKANPFFGTEFNNGYTIEVVFRFHSWINSTYKMNVLIADYNSKQTLFFNQDGRYRLALSPTLRNSCTFNAELEKIYNTSVIFQNDGEAYVNNNQLPFSDKNHVATSSFDYCYLGYRPENASCYLNGDIFCVRVYNRPLTEDERAKNYAKDIERFGIIES